MKKKKKLSLVFPAYNEQMNIERAVVEARQFAETLPHEYEIIVVNDGSLDKTAEVVRKLMPNIKELKLISHQKNLGYGAAVYDGLKKSSGDLIFFTDSDLQFDIRQLRKFLTEIEQNDLVIGYRVKRKDSFIRVINMVGWKWAVYLALGLRVRDVDCAFKLMKKAVVKKLAITSHGATFSAEMLYQAKGHNFKIKELPVKHRPRLHGKPTGAKLKVISRAFKDLFLISIKSRRNYRK